MKQLLTLKWRIFLLLVILTGFSFEAYSQCDNFTYTITTKDSPCGQNGGITILIEGPDVSGTNPTFSDLQYRVYITGTDPTDVAYLKNSTINNLAPGRYTVEILGKCLATGGYLPKLLTTNTEINQMGGWAPLGLSAVKLAESLSCLPSGAIRFYGFRGGTVSWKLEITEAPAEYTGSMILYDETLRPSEEIIIKDLPRGTYKFRFVEGSECASAVDMNFTIGGLTAMPSPFLTSYVYPGQFAVSSSLLEDDSYYCDKVWTQRQVLSANTDFAYFIENWENYFEYSVYYQGDDISDPSALAWSSFEKGQWLNLKDLRYSVSEMHEGTAYRPLILVRVKGCTDVISNTLKVKSPLSPEQSVTYANCGVATLSFRPHHDYDGPICYPYTWKLVTVAGTVETPFMESTAPLGWVEPVVVIDSLAAGRYKVYFTDANGFIHTGSASVVSSTAASHISGRSNMWGCGEQEIAGVYRSGSVYAETLKALARIKYIKSDKFDASINLWQSDNSYPAPNFPDIDVTTINKDSLNKYHNNGFVTPWAKTLDNTITPLSYSSDPTIYADLYRDKTTPVALGPRDYYRHYFEVTDTCGVTKTTFTTSSLNRYEHETAPETRVERSCSEENINIFIPNVASLIKKYSRQTGIGDFVTPYINVVERPAGATVVYKQANVAQEQAYLRLATDWIQVNKPGRYVIAVTMAYFTTSNNPSKIADLCGQTYELIIPEILEFELDESNTIAYRCKNSNVGEGYIEIKTKNGMGPFVFELWNKDRTVKLQTNDTGKFSGWPLTTDDQYVVIGYDYGCAPERIVSFQQNIEVYDLDNVPVARTEYPRICEGGRIELQSLALGETSYNWRLISPSGATWTYTGRNPVIENATPNMTGDYEITVSVPHCPGLTIKDTVSISVAKNQMYWSPEAVDNNWYNTDNWLDEGGNSVDFVPASCTNVYIPGNADYYPNLYIDATPWNVFGYPSCNTITYHYGSETAYPTYLIYNKAIVQYNLGYYNGTNVISGIPGWNKDEDYPNNGFREITRMPRAKWNMISAPLKNMTGGDFGLAGYPNLYQRLFNTPSPENGVPAQDDFTTSFSKYTIDLRDSNSALALWIADYDTWTGSADHKNLEGLQGIIEMPYFNNPEIAPFRPLNKYDEATKTSTYYYYNYLNLKPEMDTFDELVRGDDSYRFVFEGSNNEAEKIQKSGDLVRIYRMPMMKAQTGSRIMIGNPVMSHIDFDKLYALNSAIINNYYQITEASTGNTLTYRIGMPGNTLGKEIAPLQGFIISRKNPQATEDLIFEFEGNEAVIASNVDPLPKPKSTKSTDEGWILLDGITPPTALSNGDEIAVRTNLYFNFKGESIEKSYHPAGLDERAEMFFIDAANITNAYQMENAKPLPPVVRVGIMSLFTKDIRLSFTTGGTLIKTAELVDKLQNKTQNILTNPTYTFQHRYDRVESGKKGLDTDRFELRITYNEDSTTGIGENAGGYFAVSCKNKNLSLISGKEITSVKVTNLAGVAVLEEATQVTRYEKHIDLVPGTYIVEATLVDGETKTKKIIVK